MRVLFYLPWGARLSSGWSALGQPIELRVHPAERTSNLCMTCLVCLFSDALTDKKMSLTAESDLLSWDPCSGFELAERENVDGWHPLGVAQAEARTPCATSTWRFFFNCWRFQRGKLGSNRNREIFLSFVWVFRVGWFQHESGDGEKTDTSNRWAGVMHVLALVSRIMIITHTIGTQPLSRFFNKDRLYPARWGCLLVFPILCAFVSYPDLHSLGWHGWTFDLAWERSNTDLVLNGGGNGLLFNQICKTFTSLHRLGLKKLCWNTQEKVVDSLSEKKQPQ